jgi:hypothetical protein
MIRWQGSLDQASWNVRLEGSGANDYLITNAFGTFILERREAAGWRKLGTFFDLEKAKSEAELDQAELLLAKLAEEVSR